MTTPAASPTVLGVPIPLTILRALPSLLADCDAAGVTLVDAVDAARVDRARWVSESAEGSRVGA